jgi:hypothetical protein
MPAAASQPMDLRTTIAASLVSRVGIWSAGSTHYAMLCPSSALIGELVDTECLRPPVTNGAEAIVAYVISEDLRYDSTRARTFLSERRADPVTDQQLPFATAVRARLARLVLRPCAERMRDMGCKRFCVLVVCVLALPAAAQAQEKTDTRKANGQFLATTFGVRF